MFDRWRFFAIGQQSSESDFFSPPFACCRRRHRRRDLNIGSSKSAAGDSPSRQEKVVCLAAIDREICRSVGQSVGHSVCQLSLELDSSQLQPNKSFSHIENCRYVARKQLESVKMEETRPLKQLCFSCIEKRGQSLIEQTRLEQEQHKQQQQHQERQEAERLSTLRVAIPLTKAEAADSEPSSDCRRQTMTTNQLAINCANSKSTKQRNQLQQSKDQEEAVKAAAAAKSMAAVAAKLIRAAHSSSRPTLRQIDIVGQLNHSARQGFLLVLTNPLVALLSLLMLLTIALNGSPSNTAEATVWPFQTGGWEANRSGASARPTIWPSMAARHGSAQQAGNTTRASGGKREARMSGDQNASALKQQQQQQPSAGAMMLPQPLPSIPPAVSQQFHYFWNHDQIEPKVVASEAQQILADAQNQADRSLLSAMPGAAAHYEGSQRTRSIAEELRRAGNDVAAHELGETMQAASSSPAGDYQQQPIVIPAEVQQQLTALVLQMQRQQQMSRPTQSRFDQLISLRRLRQPPLGRRLGGAGSSLASPFAAWMQMAASSEQPSVLSGLHPSVGMSPRVSPPPPPTTATMAGVPVFGPFMVAPSPFQLAAAAAAAAASRAALFQQELGHHLRQQVPSARSAGSLLSPTHKASGSLFGQTGRKLVWPLFSGYFSGSNNGNSDQGGRSTSGGGGGLFAAASSARSTFLPPPPAQSADLSMLSPESMALLDMASSQLVNAIAGQMQVRAAQQRLATALNQAIETRPDFMQAAASSSSGIVSDKVAAPMGSAGKTTNLMPPYLMSPVGGYSAIPSGSAARALTMDQFVAATQPSGPTMQALQTLDMLNSIISGGSTNASAATVLNQHQQYLIDSVPFGHRLKRRHLNTVAPYTSERKLAKQLQQLSKQHQQQRHNPSGSGSHPIVANKTMMGQAKPTRPSPSAQAVAARIVKKDSAGVSQDPRNNLVERQRFTKIDHANQLSRPDASRERTGSSGNDVFMSEESKRQVRRLKRSALLFTSGDSMIKGGQSTEWKSMDSVRITNQQELLRRQAEFSSSSTAPKVEQTQAKVQPTSEFDAFLPTSTGGGNGGKGGERQEKSLKIKRVIASASVLHHPVSAQRHSSSQQLQDSSAFRRGTVIAGTPIQLNNIQQSSTTQRQDDATEAASKEAALDPMTSALAESTRVANYFQNVDNEKPSPQGSTGAKLEQPRQLASVAPQLPAPKINLAFSAPSKLVADSNSVDGEMRRMSSTATAGNGARGTQVADSQQQQQPKLRFQAGSLHRHQSQRHLATSQRGALPGAASSGDISSSAAGQGAYGTAAAPGQANAGSSLSSTMVVAPPQQPPNSQQQQQQQQQQQGVNMKLAAAQLSPQSGPIAGQSATNMANNARSNSPAAAMQTSNTASGGYSPASDPNPSGGIQQQQQQHHQSSVGRGMRDNAVQATSFNRQSVVAPGSKPLPSQVSASFERNTSADQSNNYNDEILPSMPMQNGGGGSSSYQDQSNGQQQQQANQMMQSNEPSGMLMNSADNNQNLLLGSQQQSAVVYNSMEQAQAVAAAQNEQQPAVDPISGQSMINLAAEGYGQRNNHHHQQQQQQQLQQHRMQQHNLESGSLMQDQQAGAFQSPSEQQQQLNNFAQSDPSFSGSNQSGAPAGGPEGSFVGAPDVTIPTTDTSSLYAAGLTQQPSLQPPRLQPQQQQQQQLTDNSMQQYMTMSNNNNPSLMSLPNQQQQQQQQLFSQQMRALGQAVSNFNQQRLMSQQLQTASYNPNTRTFFAPQESAHQQFQPQHHHYQQAPQYPGAYNQGAIDEEAAAGTLAAQGIATLPNAAQLMAMQNANQLAFGAAAELAAAGTGSMLIAEMARRERADDDGGNKPPKNKKNKRQSGPKQVSHHYHFNNLGSPFEDPNNEFGGLNPLEIAGSVQGNENGYVGRPMRQNKVKVKDEEEEKNEEEKPKKRGGLLRRFSLKNLFKRFRKDKKKENENNDEEDGKSSGNSSNDNESSSNSNDNSQDASSDRG